MALTNGDLKNIKTLFKQTLDEDETIVRKDDIKHLPSKDEFYTKMDEVVGELKKSREETAVLGHQVKRNTVKIEKIEKKITSAVAS